MKKLWWSVLLWIPVMIALEPSVQAHRSGCHRWHSCERDHATYIRGDLGYDTFCDKKNSSVVVPPAVVVQPTALVLDGPIKLREKPSRKAKILLQVPTGTLVNLGVCGKDWCAVEYRESRGWMMKKFLKAQ